MDSSTKEITIFLPVQNAGYQCNKIYISLFNKCPGITYSTC